MINFKKLLSETPRFINHAEAEAIVTEAEHILKDRIISSPDNEMWTHVYFNGEKSASAIKELFEYIDTNFVRMNKTQLSVRFTKEFEQGRHYEPAKIHFSISRSILKD
ncbi:hypothetical protein HYQ09_gp079 [Acinetobacter phage vB_AbaM_Konradin]|uniref:Uncharacterized protein n=4 Tax=Lazarusvirus TaxID=2842820 RepID=A0A650EV26_9CAUD|nr:hypothetical protein HYQ09_gp079 [Acinetobacter phage vB_AbaM_Konradin]YP_009886603.1 hypothetical protein HYQ22_gp082 [Acinetobacter phage vB_AbaM_Kimel]QKE55780.1 hypothetical protein Octan_078 [Acinetobacter phage Octan]QKN88022.1 hypothetical protein Abraxas_083 [Acinetobacter phage Abraxas]UNI74517.1 hypothetical protein ABNavy4_079 [Acinetobacter phage AB-Navy4]QGT53843.1 hypothetical protein Konradin_080 [Acinetobacter phage vB_AbaM_Konradin]QHB48237.1 hypothetical protein Kimel_082